MIRHPRRAIPSYYPCTITPLDRVTASYHSLPSEAAYDELRRTSDFLQAEGIAGPRMAGDPSSPRGGDGEEAEVSITVIDADDLLDHPEQVVRAYCAEVGVDFTPAMLRWDDDDSRRRATEAFEKWNGFHDDAIGSTSLKPRAGGVKTPPSRAEEDEQWRQKFGDEGQKVIRACVDANVADYEYLKSFALKF